MGDTDSHSLGDRPHAAHARAINTLKAWGIELDEAHFVGAADKGRVLAAFGAHIFFDDQERNIIAASSHVPAGHVPGRGGFAKAGS